MVIPSDPLSFEVILYQSGDTKYPEFFVTEKEAYSQKNLIQIKENVILDLDFKSDDKDARFYMDGLDALPERVLNSDEQEESYLQPCTNFSILKEDYYPLIPGLNLITVVVDGRNYYSLIEIVPTQLTTFQWKFMISEIEGILNGLSMDLVRKNIALGDYHHKSIPTVLLYKFMVINKAFPNVMAALSDLLNKINSRIKNEYIMVPTERAKIVDLVTVRYCSTHPENTQTLKVPKPTVDYDLPENRWIKKIIRHLTINLNDFIEALEEFQEDVEAEMRRLSHWETNEGTKITLQQKRKVVQNLIAYRDVAQKMRKGLEIIKLAPWYTQVSHLYPTSISSVLMSDSRYFALYKLYKELQQENFEVSIDPEYAYQYKRTDKLYEIWGYLQVCEAIKELDFEPMSGWIYDQDFDPQNILIPTLQAGSKINFVKDDLELRVTYDGALPYNSTETDIDYPIYTTASNNTPDGRIDFYKANSYIGTLIFDMKCRNLNSFFQEQYLRSSYRSKELTQLVSYATQCRSQFTSGISDPSFLKNYNPVFEVWTIHPRSSDNAAQSKFEQDHNLRFIKLAPASGNKILTKHLEEIIQEILKCHINLSERFALKALTT